MNCEAVAFRSFLQVEIKKRKKQKGEILMAVISMKQLLEAGVHFGHQTRRWNPKMAKYIFTERNGIHVIDLQQTVKYADQAYDFMRDAAANDAVVLFVGTKKQAADAVKEEAERLGQYFINTVGWVVPLLTGEHPKTYRSLKEIKRMEEEGSSTFFLRKKLHFLINNVHVLKNSWVVSKICLVSQM